MTPVISANASYQVGYRCCNQSETDLFFEHPIAPTAFLARMHTLTWSSKFVACSVEKLVTQNFQQLKLLVRFFFCFFHDHLSGSRLLCLYTLEIHSSCITINQSRILFNSCAQSPQDKSGNYDYSRHPSLVLKVVGH